MEESSTLQPLRHPPHTLCHRHPTNPVTGFCPNCLQERLSSIDTETHSEIPPNREFRRSRSLSLSLPVSSSSDAVSQPHRRSCDVRNRSTLYDLLNGDDGKKRGVPFHPSFKGLGFDLGIEINEDEVLGDGDKPRVFDEIEELKTMKEFIDLEWEKNTNKRSTHYYGNVGKNIREIASAFGRKIGKWQAKSKNRNASTERDKSNAKSDEKGVGFLGFRRWRELKSAVGEFGGGRRSCDRNPRFSVDSVVGARFSLDETQRMVHDAPPRASWDGCLIGSDRMFSHSHHNVVSPLHSVLENEKLNEKDEADVECRKDEYDSPGGTLQTRDYYSSGRRKSFDMTCSRALGRSEQCDDELKAMWNVKVSPKTVGLLNGTKLLVTEKELRNSNWYAVSKSSLEGPSHASIDADADADASGKKNGMLRKAQWWQGVWSTRKKTAHRYGDDQTNVMNGKTREAYQLDCDTAACIITKGAKRKEHLLSQRNRSTRHSSSPNNLENGLLRFYLTPLRSYGRSQSGRSSRIMNPLPISREL